MLEWRSLVSEDMKTLSLGRVAFWLCFFISSYYWFVIPNVIYPATLLYLWEGVIAYNFGSKLIRAYQNVRLPNELVGNLNSSGFRTDTYIKPSFRDSNKIANANLQVKQADIDSQDITNDDLNNN